jgi:putative Mg2+ transporter-C (MgtC) family protein
MISFPEMLLRLSLSMLLGALVGLERERREHGAGTRTIALVSLGSCLFSLISAYGYIDLTRLPHITLDPTRISSYVVAGIGFLGAGTIFFSREANRVKGLTTAATIWLIAAIGIACGAGMLLVAVTTTVLGLLVLTVLRFVEKLLLPRQFESRQRIKIEVASIGGQLIGQVYDLLTRADLKVDGLDIRAEPETDSLRVACRVNDERMLGEVVNELRALAGVRAIEVSIDTPGKPGTTARASKFEDG